ncbi:MAG: hypothetical protein H6867_03750 [Rhodospirillales bacterium]|nr:hypothetical protein [Rhodospirillales bacterium]MCB9996264.1 hypothetical protein [Rhodospirillales bacterium]
MKYLSLLALCLTGLIVHTAPAAAGLDLANQQEIALQDLDLDHNGRITREEAGTYMFFYFDYDGNESLSRGEYGKERPVTLLPYDGEGITFIDLDHDGTDDGTDFTIDSFLAKVMVDEYDPENGKIEAKDVIGTGYLKADTDRSKYIELDEWLKIYARHATKKGNLPPKAANEDRYRD